MDRLLQAAQLRRALQLVAQTITDESQMMEVADLYPDWTKLVEKMTTCKAGTVCKYGLNANGEVQLYQFVSDYQPVAHYTPDADITHYKVIGFAGDGTPIWTQPLGATDAYQAGDVVSHLGRTWMSDIDGNVWAPGAYGWTTTT